MKHLAVTAALLTAVLIAGERHGVVLRAQSAVSRALVVASVRVFDGERVHEQADVTVADGVIRSVGAPSQESRRLPVIDGRGSTLLPGFIDTHAHVQLRDELREALRFGVTAVLDMGATIEPRALFALRADAAVATDIADLRTAGFLARPPRDQAPADPRMRWNIPPVRTEGDAPGFVEERAKEGIDYLKLSLTGVRSRDPLVPYLGAARAKALVEAAHHHGLLTVAHIQTIEDVLPETFCVFGNMASSFRATNRVTVFSWLERGANTSRLGDHMLPEGLPRS